MRHRSNKLLRDIRTAALEILAIASGKTFHDYERDRLLRPAIERYFVTIGEAVRRIRNEDPEVFRRIANASRIIGFRNILVHAYDIVEDDEVWDIVQHDLPKLLAEVEALVGSE